MMRMRSILLAGFAVVLTCPCPALAQDADARAEAEAEAGVPSGVLVMPSAEARPRVGMDGPRGPAKYDVELPRGTPDEYVTDEVPEPVTRFTDALDRAYWTHPALLDARARLRATDYRLPQARSAGGLRLSYDVRYGYQRDNVEQSATLAPVLGKWIESAGWSSSAAAVLTQPVYTFGRIAAGEKQAKAEIAFQRAALRSAETLAYYNAIRAYAGLLRDRKAIEIYREDLDLLNREYSDNAARFTKREVTSSDVQQVETRVGQSRAQLFAAQRNLADSEANFLSYIGAPAAEDLASPNPLSMPVRTLEDAYAYAELNSPVLAAAYARERISRAAIVEARAELFPRVDLRGTARYGSRSAYSDALRTSELRGEVVVSGTLYSNGQRSARLREAEAANDGDWRLIDKALRETRAEIAAAWDDWLAQTASIEPLRQASEAARKAYEGALLQEKAGFRTTLDVLNLERELLVARSSYNAATANAYVAQARVLASIGALERKWLSPDEPAYDPDAHQRKTRHYDMAPGYTALYVNILDRTATGGGKERPIRDPAAPLAAPGVDLPVPEMAGPDAEAPDGE